MGENGDADTDAADDEAETTDDETANPSDDDTDLPSEVVERATTLTQRAREAVDEGERMAYRTDRETLLDSHDYVARVREDDETLVLHPAEWLEGDVVQVDRVEDTTRAVEVSLGGPGEGDWDAVEAHNRTVAERVEDEHGPVHGANAHAFADFMSNHYAKPLEDATPAEREEFLTEYYPRNAWPSDDQRAVVSESLELVLRTVEETD